MESPLQVAVFGAYGHTGRFVVAELLERGLRPVLAGRDTERLQELARAHPGLDVRPASTADPDSLTRALAGTAAVINCAGPFAATAAPVIEAALAARIPYADIAGEVEAVADTFAHYTEPARAAGLPVIPAMAFFGALGDLLTTAALGDWPSADEVSLAYALSSWHPTAGTRASSQVSRERRNGRRLVLTNGSLALRTDQAPTTQWVFPPPLGKQTVVAEFTTADSITLSRHIRVPHLHTYMTAAAVKDVLAPGAEPPVPIDANGRSDQTFLVEAVVRNGETERRATARGQDIYAVSAPLVVEAICRVLDGRTKTVGAAAPGEIFDAPDFLRALSSHLTVEFAPHLDHVL
ncbi:saccharopine dehydrogenase family protein [Streptomyces bugieae]|uniref:Saccharopine dehydrogenase NADP-binding domain-containing protein n=1 Tax=Streptomyces bugieae TaxID=3098223 RepID=A0ABU7NGN4_9ACTN|nr:saccharopine dehydrogenase NADP-binding domain-containing protein [Streptomyces sp. DSM 41528]